MRGTLRSGIARKIAFAAGAGGGICAAVAFAAAVALGVDAIGFALAAGVGAAAASAAIAWPLATFSARRMTSHLESLAAASTSFAAGDRSARASAGGPREVRLVAESFNRIASDVSSALEQLSSEETRNSQFVSDVSHELRTPLTAIRGAAETLLDGGVDHDDQERFLSTIAAEAERLTRLANDLLQLQRIEGATGELPFRRIELRVAAEKAAAMLEPLIEDRGVQLHVSGESPAVLGDLDRMQQVIANLVDNASRMVGEGGNVWVELSSEGDAAVLSVTDDGPGIAEEDLGRLFDRFYRADTSRTRSSGGLGLGLAIVRAIVGSHGGTIEAENLEQGGARLTVRLPALPPDES